MPKRTPLLVKAPPSSRVRVVLLGWFALTIGVLLVLRSLGIGLGQGSFAYRYSEMQGVRMVRALWLVPIAGVVALAIYQATRQRRSATWIALIAVILLGIWTFFAPIQAMTQHAFNLRSPSHDGAFVNEMYGIRTLGEYLRGFDARIQKSPAELMGTRVISNPPGTTILFYGVIYAWRPNVESPGWLERFLQREYGVRDDALVGTMITVQLAGFLTLLWMLSAIVLYRTARMFLAPAAAMLCVLIAWFNPSTTHFVPGKDPAQLLTVGLMLWTWLIAWKGNQRCITVRPHRQGRHPERYSAKDLAPTASRDPSRSTAQDDVHLRADRRTGWRTQAIFAAISGAITLASATIGLIHIWVAFAMIVATLWHSFAQRESLKRFFVRLLLPFAAGVCASVLLAFVLFDWNVLKTLFTVWRRFAHVQRELALDHTIWFVIGIPLFLLFISPSLALFATSHHRRNFGWRLSIVTVSIMLISYVVGVTYELPRLWVVFLPLITLGLVIASPLAHVRHQGRAARLAIIIAIVHIAFTASHWSMLDARESEMRLRGDNPIYFGSGPNARKT